MSCAGEEKDSTTQPDIIKVYFLMYFNEETIFDLRFLYWESMFN